MASTNLTKHGDAALARMERVNSDLLSLTYGTLVTQLLKDIEHVETVNCELEKMGYNIGIRLVDEFLAKSGVGNCSDFKETAEVIAKVGLKMFLGVVADVVGWNAENTSCSLVLHENPLVDFVDLPESLNQLQYSNLICGVIRGALEQLHMKVSCYFVKDVLKGDDCYDIRLELVELLREEFIDDEDS